jgi:hypothetical protein
VAGLLIENDHWAAAEVSEKLIALSNEKQYLLTLWEERRMLYEQCIELLYDGTNNPSEEAEENPTTLSDEESDPCSPDLFPVCSEGMSQECHKEFALQLMDLACLELSYKYYERAKYN